jgi:predicted SAM-dependent methyltransferase
MLGNLRNNSVYRFAAGCFHGLVTKWYLTTNENGYYCPGCKKHWKHFKPFPKKWLQGLEAGGWPYKREDVETLNYDNYTCYGCGITDRDRLYLLFIEKKVIANKEYSIVEFAPRAALSKRLKELPNVTHRTSDLFMKEVDDQLDLQNLHLYKDNSFDLFICSHILEHVEDDIKAMKELYRILKPGGFGITMVPIITTVIETKEDPSIKDPLLRTKYFGQSDHVRLYAKHDFIQRLQSVGFKVNLYEADYFGKALFDQCGITQQSVLYTVEK